MLDAWLRAAKIYYCLALRFPLCFQPYSKTSSIPRALRERKGRERSHCNCTPQALIFINRTATLFAEYINCY